MSALLLPRFYAIIDSGHFSALSDPTGAIINFARELAAGGARLIQYRNKSGSAREMLGHARELRRVLGDRAKLIMNDRADLCLAADFDGVHLGQDDLSPMAARKIFTAAGRPDLCIGYSTHNPEQLRAVEQMPVDYVAIGPVFTTASKANPDPVIGVEGVRLARGITAKPLVAIGGITRQNCKFVTESGADTVAVISDIVESPHKATEEFLRILR
jgi:thiamine-phosphate pyrophosphorylase